MQAMYPHIERSWPQPSIPTGLRNGRELLEGSGYVRLPMGVARISGEDRYTWLGALSSQDFTPPWPRETLEALVLDPLGHVESSFFVREADSALWLLSEETSALVEFLQALRFRARVEVCEMSEEYQVFGCLRLGSDSENEAGGSTRDSAWQVLSLKADLTMIDPWPGPVGHTTTFTTPNRAHPAAQSEAPTRCFALLRGETSSREHSSQLPGGGKDIVESDLGAWEAVRVSLWRPRLGREGMPGVLPHEADWLRTAVSLEKGCYPGQETVAKLTNRGRPPRRLTFLDFDGTREELPAAGAEIVTEQDDQCVGTLTSSAYHPTDGPIGLALINRRVPPDAMLVVEGMRAAQTVVVDPSGNNPRRIDEGKPGGLLGLRGRK